MKTTAQQRPTRTRQRARRAALAVGAASAAAATLFAFPSTASADSDSREVPIGPGLGLQCTYPTYAYKWASGYGFVTEGTGANFQLRFGGSQVAGSGAQVESFFISVGEGNLAWRGPGYYSFCARNNGSPGKAFLSLETG
jgi:hypothetical protein